MISKNVINGTIAFRGPNLTKVSEDIDYLVKRSGLSIINVSHCSYVNEHGKLEHSAILAYKTNLNGGNESGG